MIIIGFDPGTRNAGFSVVQVDSRYLFKVLEAGVWRLQKTSQVAMGVRLETLAHETEQLLKKYNPSFIGLEKAVVFKNPSSSLKLAEARGVIRLVAHQILDKAESRIIEVSPTQVKKSISGTGSSQKKDVKQSVLRRFSEAKDNEKIEDYSDSYDAIAVAVAVLGEIKKQRWSGLSV